MSLTTIIYSNVTFKGFALNRSLHTHQEPATVLRAFLHVMAVLMCVQGRLKLSVDSEKHLSTASS